jgi:transposase
VRQITTIRAHEQEGVETRTRVRKPMKEEMRTMEPIPGAATTPNYLRPCLGLDVHKNSITATRLGPGGAVLKTWNLTTTRTDVLALTRDLEGTTTPIVLEASTAGKAVASLLKGVGSELHMAAPNLIPKPSVKTDKRDSVRLAQLYQSGSLPECYIPPPEIDHLRLLIRSRRDLGIKVTLVKNQVHALVTRNLLDSEMTGVSDWFGVGGLRKLVRLPLDVSDRSALARHLEQLELLAQQEEAMQIELAGVARERKDVQLLMTIPGVDYYTAVGIVAEVGDVRRFPTKQRLASYAGLVPKADNSGDQTSEHRSVKKGDMVLKGFLCTAVRGMLKSSQPTAVAAFYRKKAKGQPAQKATVAAARKLSAEIWKMLTFEEPYREEDADLTERKEQRMQKKAAEPATEYTVEELEKLADRVSGKAEVLQRLAQEIGDVG